MLYNFNEILMDTQHGHQGLPWVFYHYFFIIILVLNISSGGFKMRSVISVAENMSADSTKNDFTVSFFTEFDAKCHSV